MTDYKSLNDYETLLVQDRMTQLINNPLNDFSPTLDGLKNIHSHLFQDVYEWGGKVRGEDLTIQGKSFTPELTDSWISKNAATGVIEAEFAAKPLTETKLMESLEQDSKALSRLLDNQALGEKAIEQVIPKLSRMVGAINQLHPFWDGNGRAMKGFIEQTGRSFGINANTKDMSRDDWIRATALAKDGKTASLTKLMRANVTVMTKGQLLQDTKAEGINTPKPEETAGLLTPTKRSFFTNPFRRNIAEKAAPAPRVVPLSKDKRINEIIDKARALDIKTGRRSAEKAALQASILTAAKEGVPLLGTNADPALLREAATNKVLMGEVLSAQAAVDGINKIKGLIQNVENQNNSLAADQKEKLTPEQRFEQGAKDILDTEQNNLYMGGLAQSLAYTNKYFRTFYTAFKITEHILKGQNVETQMTDEQIQSAVKDMSKIQKAERYTRETASELYQYPDKAIKEIATLRAQQGFKTSDIERIIDKSPKMLGAVKPFRKGLLGKQDEMALKRAQARFRNAISEQSKITDVAVNKVKQTQAAIVEGLSTTIEKPTRDLDKLIAKEQSKESTLKALPKSVDKDRIVKETKYLKTKLNDQTKIFGQSIPGVSDKKMAQFKAINKSIGKVQALAQGKAISKTLNNNKPLSL